jgi:hypothetical protein
MNACNRLFAFACVLLTGSASGQGQGDMFKHPIPLACMAGAFILLPAGTAGAPARPTTTTTVTTP